MRIFSARNARQASAMADGETGVGNRPYRVKFRSRVHTPYTIRQTSGRLVATKCWGSQDFRSATACRLQKQRPDSVQLHFLGTAIPIRFQIPDWRESTQSLLAVASGGAIFSIAAAGHLGFPATYQALRRLTRLSRRHTEPSARITMPSRRLARLSRRHTEPSAQLAMSSRRFTASSARSTMLPGQLTMLSARFTVPSARPPHRSARPSPPPAPLSMRSARSSTPPASFANRLFVTSNAEITGE